MKEAVFYGVWHSATVTGLHEEPICEQSAPWPPVGLHAIASGELSEQLQAAL
jgi:hypothetical protein